MRTCQNDTCSRSQENEYSYSAKCLKRWAFKTNVEYCCTNVRLSSEFFIRTGLLQLMEIGDVQRKDIMDHPENYTLLTTLDEGLFHDAFLWNGPDLLQCDYCCFGGRFTLIQVHFSDTWRKFKEEGDDLSKASQTTICEEGIREMVTFLNPRQIEDLCSP